MKIKTPKGKREIGPGNPVFIVAEMSGNHNQDIKKAFKIIDAAAYAGVDAVKLQTYTADTITINSDRKWFKINKGPWKGKTLYELYKSAYTPWEWQKKLKKYAEKKGLVVFSSPFDETAVDFLEKLKVELYKVASFEVVDMGLLEKIGQTKKPVIISRGMANLEEIKLAIKTLRQNGSKQIAILHCISDYPADPKDMNLATIPDLAKKFGVVSGLSDHTLGITTSIAAVALGASIIEKHLTIDRSEGGPDAGFSLEPQELKELVNAIREVELSIGKPQFSSIKKEDINKTFRRSLFVVKDIRKGEKFTRENVRSIRPGHGLATKYFKKILGKSASFDIEAGTPLSWKLIKNL
ncbi:MAG: pseudaminic acid synthase [Patescibacteria group bacterium]